MGKDNKISLADYLPVSEFYPSDDISIKIVWREGRTEPFVTALSIIQDKKDSNDKESVLLYGPYLIIYDPCDKVDIDDNITIDQKKKSLFIVDTNFGIIGIAPFKTGTTDMTDSVQETIAQIIAQTGKLVTANRKQLKTILH